MSKFLRAAKRLRTSIISNSVADGMQDALNSRDTSSVSMENVEGRERPPSYPKKDVVASGKEPDQRKVGEANDSGAVCEITPELIRC